MTGGHDRPQGRQMAMPEELRGMSIRAKKLLNECARVQTRGGATTIAPAELAMFACMAIAAEIADIDGSAGFDGLCAAMAAIAQQHGQSLDFIKRAAFARFAIAYGEDPDAEQG